MSPLNVPFLCMSGSLSNSGAVHSNSKKNQEYHVELRLLQIKCLNEGFSNLRRGSNILHYLLYQDFISCDVLETLNFNPNKKNNMNFPNFTLPLKKKYCLTNNLYPMVSVLNFNIRRLLTIVKSFHNFFGLKISDRQNVGAEAWISCCSFTKHL